MISPCEKIEDTHCTNSPIIIKIDNFMKFQKNVKILGKKWIFSKIAPLKNSKNRNVEMSMEKFL